MPTLGEHKTVQAYILRYAQEIGWTYVPRNEAEARRGFDPSGATSEERAHKAPNGKIYTMIKVAEPLFKAPEAEKPTILLMIDRNELEDQMLKNHGKLWKSLMRAHLGEHEQLEARMKHAARDHKSQ